jgi:hypothetical protein
VSSAPFIILLGSDQPVPGDAGRAWRATDGEPKYRRVIFADTEPGELGYGPDVSVWVGRQIDALEEPGDPAAAAALLAVGQEPAPGHETEFNAWMDNEHVPGLGAAPGTLSAHRYQAVQGKPGYYAVYHLRDLDVNSTPEWKAVGASATSQAMKPHSRNRVRGLYVPE